MVTHVSARTHTETHTHTLLFSSPQNAPINYLMTGKLVSCASSTDLPGKQHMHLSPIHPSAFTYPLHFDTLETQYPPATRHELVMLQAGAQHLHFLFWFLHPSMIFLSFAWQLCEHFPPYDWHLSCNIQGGAQHTQVLPEHPFSMMRSPFLQDLAQ